MTTQEHLDSARAKAVLTNQEKYRVRINALIKRAVNEGARSVFEVCVVVARLEYMRGFAVAKRRYAHDKDAAA